MTDYFLRAVDEAALQNALQTAGFYSPEMDYLLASLSHGLDIIGPVVKLAGTYDEAGNVLTPPVLYAGFHANLRLLSGELPDCLKPYLITPKTPSVVWF